MLNISQTEKIEFATVGPRVKLEEPHFFELPQAAGDVLLTLEQRLARLVWARLASENLLEGEGSLAPFYIRWRDAALQLLQSQGFTPDAFVPDWNDQWAQWQTYREEVKGDVALSAQVMLVDTTLQALPTILRGELPATEVLFPQGQLSLVDGVYRNNPVADYFNAVLAERFEAYVRARLAEDSKAKLNIVEIGAGTGSTSTKLFERLVPYAAHIETYCYTDLSPAFLLHAQNHYASLAPYLKTQRLDIERSPQMQGFALGEYDVAVAANVLHATSDIRHTLRQVKTLLRGNGLLMLNELSGASLFTHLTFGLLDGWWLARDRSLRIDGTPALSKQSWRLVLQSEGFQSVKVFGDEHSLGQQILVATSDGVVRVTSPTLSIASSSTKQRAADRAPARHKATPTRAHDASASPSPNASVYQTIRTVIAEALMLDQAELQDDQAFSAYGVDSITGVALVNELNRRLALSLPTTVLFDYATISQLSTYIRSAFGANLNALQTAGVLTGPMKTGHKDDPKMCRVPQATGRQRRRSVANATVIVPGSPLASEADSQQYHRIWLERPCSIDDLRIVEDSLPSSLGAHEVRIAIRAFSLDSEDLLCVKGLYPMQPSYPFTPGVEASGIVVDIGEQVKRVAVGDAVIALAGDSLGSQATVMTCADTQVFSQPKGLSFEAACAMPTAALTMIDCFAKIELKPGERILIQNAAGDAGLIAVQLAQHAGAEVYATVSSAAKLDHLASLGVKFRINYDEEDFETVIQQLTDRRGVDVVINMLAGDAVQKGLNCLAPGGRYIEIAMTALKSARGIEVPKLKDNQTFDSVELGRTQPETLRRGMREMERLLETGVIGPTLIQAFTFEQIQDAYRCLEKRRDISKVVVSIPETYRFKARVSGAPRSEREPIAVIGMSGRFARANTLKELWHALASGEDLIEEVTRWDLAKHYTRSDRPYCRRGGLLRDIDVFDPLFFNISGAEASAMDPQQRLFLEEAWRTLEDAGYAGKGIEGQRCGVYVGCTNGDYHQLLDENAPAQAFWGNAGSLIPARIAYHLDLRGPAVAIDTACSSSLVAVHQACQGLRAGEMEVAIAGGVFVQSTEAFYLKANRASMLSPEGRCHTFDARADGFVPGEGVGAILLKRLSKAQADGDHIYGVIYGSGINQDGATNGITAPSARSQTLLEREVYQRYDIDPNTIQLVEAHGTGTALGDPIEFRALTEAFTRDGGDCGQAQRCAIGSIKSNLGHTVTAAGIAGLIKVLLALRHRQIPPSLHFQQRNAHIDFEHSPFYVPTKLKAWDTPTDGIRLAATSSFSLNGTNAHAVIGEAPGSLRPCPQQFAYLIVLSARSAAQLRVQVEQLAEHLESEVLDASAISFTLLMGRRHFEYRWACAAPDSASLLAQLKHWLMHDRGDSVVTGQVQPTHDAVSGLVRYGHQCISEWSATQSPQVATQSLMALAQLYVQGIGVEWERLFDAHLYSRVSLPTYPFAREQFWARQNQLPDRLQQDSRPPDALTAPRKQAQMLLLAPEWTTIDPAAMVTQTSEWASHWIIACEIDVWTSLADELAPAQYVQLTATGSLADRYASYAERLLLQIQQIMENEPGGPTLVQLVLPAGHEAVVFHGLNGLLRSAQWEYSHLTTQVLVLESLEGGQSILAAKSILPEGMVRVTETGTEALRWVEQEPTDVSSPWRDGGVYWIVGGLSGLGKVFARMLAHGAHDPVVILSGRSALLPEQEVILQQLRETGARVEYHAVAVDDEKAMVDLARMIVNSYGKLNGVIHCAGVLRDRLIMKKTAAELQEVFAPKVMGLATLDSATGNIPLDWMVLCSSISAVWGNAGQADYAAANGFMDGYAQHRQALVDKGLRHGRTVSLNWPLWAEGGMQVDKRVEAWLYRTLGLDPLPNDAGVAALTQALAQPKVTEHLMVLYGERTRVLEGVRAQEDAPHLSLKSAQNAVRYRTSRGQGHATDRGSLNLTRRVVMDLVDHAHRLLEVPRDVIDTTTPLAEYGFDSISAVDFAHNLSEYYGVTLAPTLFLTHPSLEMIAEYLLEADELHLPAFYQLDARESDMLEPEHEVEPGGIRGLRSLTERKRIFDAELDRLDKQLRPVSVQPLFDALSPYAGQFPVAEDMAGNLWIFIQTGAGNTIDHTESKVIQAVFSSIHTFADFTRTKFIYLTHRDKDFSLGGNRDAFLNSVLNGKTEDILQIGESMRALLDIMEALPCITVGVAYGNAQGGGMELLMATDLQFVWPGLKVGFPEVNSGLFAGMGGLSYVSSVIGPSRALRLNISGELMSSEDAASYGLISHLSDSPFFDALGLQSSNFEFNAALAVKRIVNGPKYQLFRKDIDDWVSFVNAGSFIAMQQKIVADFDLIKMLAGSVNSKPL